MQNKETREGSFMEACLLLRNLKAIRVELVKNTIVTSSGSGIKLVNVKAFGQNLTPLIETVTNKSLSGLK